MGFSRIDQRIDPLAQRPLDYVRIVDGWLAELKRDLASGERAAIYGVLRQAVPNFAGELETAN